MNKKIELNKLQKEKLIVGMALLLCFVIHILIIKQYVNWYNVDADGYLCHAATFTGRDWSGAFKNLEYFYSWGYSLLLAIPMLFTSNMSIVYYIAIVFNAIFCCGILLISYLIARELEPEANKYLLILCSTAVSVYSSYICYGSVVLAEILLCFTILISCFFLLHYIKSGRLLWGLLTGLSVGYAYIVHNRAIAVVVAYVIISIAWSIKRKNWKNLFIMLAPLIFMLIVNCGVLNYLNIHEKQGQNYSKNIYTAYINKFNQSGHFYTIISVFQCVLGECWYILIGSVGMIGVGMYGIICRTHQAWKNKHNDLFWYVFLILLMLAMLGVSVLGCMPRKPLSDTGRYDAYIYGRYWECVLGIVMLFGFITVCEGLKKNILIIISLSSIFLSVITEYMTSAYQNNWYNNWAIPAVLNTYFYPEKLFSVTASSIVGITFMVLLFYLFAQRKVIYIVISISIWMLFNTFTGYNVIYNVSDTFKTLAYEAHDFHMPFYNTDFNDICNYIKVNTIEEFAVCSLNNEWPLIFQIVLSDNKIVGITSNDAWEEMEVYVFDKLTWTDTWKGNMLYENDSFTIVAIQ